MNQVPKYCHLPSKRSSISPRSTSGQSTTPPLWYTLSYEDMLAVEKKGTRSRTLSICRRVWRSGRRICVVGAEGVGRRWDAGGRAFWGENRGEAREKWRDTGDCFAYLCDWERPYNLCEAIEERFWEPVFGTVHCVHGVCDEDPLVAVDCVRDAGIDRDGENSHSHLELLSLQDQK